MAWPDFTPMSQMSWMHGEDEAALSRLMKVIEERTGRSFAGHSFASEEEAKAFCEDLGFVVSERPQLDGSYELTSLELAHRQGGTVARLVQELKLWEMRLA